MLLHNATKATTHYRTCSEHNLIPGHIALSNSLQGFLKPYLYIWGHKTKTSAMTPQNSFSIASGSLYLSSLCALASSLQSFPINL